MLRCTSYIVRLCPRQFYNLHPAAACHIPFASTLQFIADSLILRLFCLIGSVPLDLTTDSFLRHATSISFAGCLYSTLIADSLIKRLSCLIDFVPVGFPTHYSAAPHILVDSVRRLPHDCLLYRLCSGRFLKSFTPHASAASIDILILFRSIRNYKFSFEIHTIRLCSGRIP